MSKQSRALVEANERGLLSWQEIADELARRTGHRISRQRVFQICKRAEKKIRKALAEGLV